MRKLPFAALKLLAIVTVSLVAASQARAQQIVVPGSGKKVAEVFDDFEDPNWNYIANEPKASEENDHQARQPTGHSANGKWFEPTMRGQPDVVKRVETPPGGLPGSKGSMMFKTLWSGVPGKPSYKPQQDDLVADIVNHVGLISVSRSPSVVTRVFVPPFDQWEKRTGNSFGFRAGVHTTTRKSSGRLFGGSYMAQEPYWPGMFITFYSKKDSGQKEDSAAFLIRADESGHDVMGPKIEKTGWYTLGMSFTPDGAVHYFIREGVGDLTAKDHVYSSHPYSYKCEQFETFFYNVVNMDDGKTWSTTWIVDDPALYVDGR